MKYEAQSSNDLGIFSILFWQQLYINLSLGHTCIEMLLLKD